MLCFSGSVKGVFPGITFSANAVNITEEQLLLSRELKKSKDETAVKRSFWGFSTTVFRCALQHDASGKLARLWPAQSEEEVGVLRRAALANRPPEICIDSSPNKALLLVDVPAEYGNFGPSRFDMVGGSKVIFSKYGLQYWGSSYCDYFYLVVLEPGASVTVRQKSGCSGMADLFTVTFDGEQAFHTQHEEPAQCDGACICN